MPLADAMTLLPDIERYIERNFAAPDRTAVLDLIGNAVLHDGQPPDRGSSVVP
jgi:hypothetical protein